MKSPLLTCLKRPATIWGVLMVLGMCNGLFQLASGIVRSVTWLSPDMQTASLSEVGKRSLFGLAAMFGLGMILSGVIQELWTTAALRHVQGLRRRLRRELLLAGFVAMALLVVLALLDATEHQTSLSSAAVWPLLPLGLILGLTIFEPRWVGTGTIVTLLVLFAASLGVEWASKGLATEMPIAMGLLHVLAIGTAVLLVWLLTGLKSQSATLVKQLDGRLNTHRSPLDIQPWERRLRLGTLPDSRWTGGPIRTLSDHFRALDFERWGWTRKGWPFGFLGATGFVLVMVWINALWVNLLPAEAPTSYFATISEMLGRPELDSHTVLNRTWLMANLLPGFVYAALLVINDRKLPAFRVGHLYPLSREQRITLIVRGSRAAWIQTLVPMTLATGVLWLAATVMAGVPMESAPPLFLITGVAAGASLPLIQLTAALRETRGNRSPNPLVSVSWMILMFSLNCAVLFGVVVLTLELGALGGWLTLAITALAMPLGQWLFQRYIEQRFRTLDLA